MGMSYLDNREDRNENEKNYWHSRHAGSIRISPVDRRTNEEVFGRTRG